MTRKKLLRLLVGRNEVTYCGALRPTYRAKSSTRNNSQSTMKITKEHRHKTNGNSHKAIAGDTEDNNAYAEANGMVHIAESEKKVGLKTKLAACMVVIMLVVFFLVASCLAAVGSKLGTKLLSLGATSETKAKEGDIAKCG